MADLHLPRGQQGAFQLDSYRNAGTHFISTNAGLSTTHTMEFMVLLGAKWDHLCAAQDCVARGRCCSQRERLQQVTSGGVIASWQLNNALQETLTGLHHACSSNMFWAPRALLSMLSGPLLI